LDEESVMLAEAVSNAGGGTMILIPAMLDDWKHRLTESPTTQTRSVLVHLADRWQSAGGFPVEVARLLATAEATRNASLLLAVPNHQVPLAAGAHASHLDLWVLARTVRGLVSIAVDGVGTESFDAEAGNRAATPDSQRLWKGLRRLLEIDESAGMPVSSQLVHRTTTALVEATRFFAHSAALIVHSFSEGRQGFSDFQQFVKLMGGSNTEPGKLIEVPSREGVELFFGWAQAPHISAAPSGA
jgi:hypothetical protein